jgi:hypothetical protein
MKTLAWLKSGAAASTILIGVSFFPGCNSSKNEQGTEQKTVTFRKAPLTVFSEEITSPVHEFEVKAGGSYTLDVTVTNTGTEPWLQGDGPLFVDAGYRWHDISGATLPFEGTRARLTRPAIRPGESDSLKLQVLAQPRPGSYTLWVSMVQEGIAWFFEKNAKPLIIPVKIT